MNLKKHIFILFVFVHYVSFAQDSDNGLTLDYVINVLSLQSSSAKIEQLHFKNEILQFENYKKSLLTSFALTLNPVNFNRAIKLLQQPSDGSYSYVEDYSNNSSVGLSINQRLGLTGGNLSIASTLDYLNEFSQDRHSFSTTPFSIGYSQQIWGAGKLYKFEKKIEFEKNLIAIKKYSTNISQIQQEVLELFLNAFQEKLKRDLANQNAIIDDSLLYISKVKMINGHITEYDYKQLELQALNTKYLYENADNNYKESIYRLATFLGIANDSIDIIMPNFDLPLFLDINMVFLYVQKNNPFSIEKKIERWEAEKQLFATKISNKFNGEISLNYGMNQYANSFIGAYRRGNIRQAITLSLSIPIFQWGTNRNNLRIAENTLKISELAIDQSMQEFYNDIREKVNTYNHVINMWFTAEKAYMLSQERYRMLVEKFFLEKISIFELINAQQEQNSAMERYYSAMKEVYTNYYQLRQLSLYDFINERELIDNLLDD